MQGSWQCPKCRTLYFTKKGSLFRKSKKIRLFTFPNGFSCCAKCYYGGYEWAIKSAVNKEE